MLVLERHIGQEILIGDDIIIRVARVKGNGVVRLAIDAPKGLRIYRREVYDAIKQENSVPKVCKSP